MNATVSRRGLPIGAEKLLGRSNRNAWLLAVGVVVLSVGSGIAMANSNAVDPRTAGWVLFGVLFGCLIWLPIAMWWQNGRVRRQLKRFARGEHIAHWQYSAEEWPLLDQNWQPGDPPGEAYIGTHAAYWGGNFHEWNVLGTELANVELIDDPRSTLKVYVLQYTPQGDNVLQYIAIPVARGKEAEARHALRALTQIQRQTRPWLRACVAAVGLIMSILLLAVWMITTFAK